jgi:hypothetical protein
MYTINKEGKIANVAQYEIYACFLSSYINQSWN